MIGSSTASPLAAQILGIGCWSPWWSDWPSMREALLDDGLGTSPAQALESSACVRPTVDLLARNEQRRAPLAVLMSVAAAHEAVRLSGLQPATLPSVFASAHGDLDTVDELCRTLASEPVLLSPTRFHHSVHNAASGYWTQAVGAHAPSTALAAYGHTFSEGLREAVLQVREGTPVLLVAADTEAPPGLQSLNTTRGPLAVALVLGPAPSTFNRVEASEPPCPAAPVLQRLGGNPLSEALPLLQALAQGHGAVKFPLHPHGCAVLTASA